MVFKILATSIPILCLISAWLSIYLYGFSNLVILEFILVMIVNILYIGAGVDAHSYFKRPVVEKTIKNVYRGGMLIDDSKNND